jgi:short-subunit dehydrogenase
MDTPHVILITGASTGIGEALALHWAKAGHTLVLVARSEDALKRVAEHCKALGGMALVVPADLTIEAQARDAVQRTIDAFGRLDVVVNNAGITMWARFDELTSLHPAETLFRVNVMSALYVTHAALPHLKASRGRLAAVASLTGLTGVPTRSVYAATKHAMRGFFDTLRIELKPFGVSVTVAYPGFVNTGVRAKAMGPDGQPLGFSLVQEQKVMDVDTCARLIASAVERRKRQEVMTLRGKLGRWLQLVAPGLVDRIAERAISEGR